MCPQCEECKTDGREQEDSAEAASEAITASLPEEVNSDDDLQERDDRDSVREEAGSIGRRRGQVKAGDGRKQVLEAC